MYDMYGSNKEIGNGLPFRHDPEGHALELEHWSPRVASRLAGEEGLILEETHWEVLFCLREHFRDLEPEWSARELTRVLERDFGDRGGRRYLYELFPHGPIVQGCRLAGLPLPGGTLSPSFGSVH